MPEAPKRRPAEGGYPRGDEKRARIIAAALRRFGEDGYDGASTRDIAVEAGVNPPAIQYYFSGKDGLWLACGAHIADRFTASMLDAYRRASSIGTSPDAAVDALCAIMDALADFLFDTAQSEGMGPFLARSFNKDGGEPRDQALGSRVAGELQDHCDALVGLATGRPADAEDTRLQTVALMGQLTAFLHDHESVLRRLDWEDVRGRRLRALKAVLRANAAAILGAARSPGEAGR